MVAKFAGFLLLLLTFGAVQANADSIYQVTGTLTIPGNSANPGVSETVNYSFELDYPTNLIPTEGQPLLFGTPKVTSSGPLGTFAGPFLSSVVQGYIAFGNSAAEIDLWGSFTTTTVGFPTFSPSIFASYVYSCRVPNVCSEFYPGYGLPGTQNGGPSGLWWRGTANASIYLVSTPEPGTLCLLGLGALALCLKKKTLTH